MKAELGASSYRVSLDESDVRRFADRWPCYSERRPIAFVFSRENGDLVDTDGDESGTAGDGLAALANDASLAGALALGLAGVAAMREPFSGIAGDPMTKAEALDYAPQWGSYIRAGDPGAVMYGIDINPPDMSLAYLATLYSEADQLSDVLQLRRLAMWLESAHNYLAEPMGGDPMQAGGRATEEQRQRRPSHYGRCISAKDWRRLGGLRNGRLYRVQAANGRWRYYDSGE